jgi:hypothetical protein
MKFCIFAAACVCLIYYSLTVHTNPTLESLGAGEYTIYSRENVQSNLVTRRIDTGLGFMYFTHSQNAAALRALFRNIDGESITLTNINARTILKKLNYSRVSTSFDGIMQITYAYSNRGHQFITVNNSRVNLQIAETHNRVTVGWPVILGTF